MSEYQAGQQQEMSVYIQNISEVKEWNKQKRTEQDLLRILSYMK